MNYSPQMSGVRYITEEFIRHRAKENNPDRIIKLVINGGKDEKPVKYMENLNGFTNIEILNFNHNIIEKIEKIEKLTNLKELYLSDNKIKRLDGIENLHRLKVLNVSQNLISTIPNWLPKRCKYLMKINLSDNKFESLEEISKLWSLKDLTILNLKGNALTHLPHYRLYVIMRLKYLIQLDDIKIEELERIEANGKYENNAIDTITSKLMTTQDQLEEANKQEVQYKKEKEEFIKIKKQFEQNEKEKINRIQQLEEEVKMKEQQLKKKSDDLFRACNKYYELEQDLAFIKIDAKFDILSKDIGSLEEPDNSSEQSYSGVSTGDQPYMGKGQFITPEEKEMLRKRMKSKKCNGINGDIKNGTINQVTEIKENFCEALDERIKDKLAELENVNKELEERAKQMLEYPGSSNDVQLRHPLTEAFTLNTPKVGNNHLRASDSIVYGTPMNITNGASRERPKSALASASKRINSPLRTVTNLPRKLSFSEGSAKQLPTEQDQLAEKFMNKFEILNEMQKEAHELRRKMDSTERLANRQREDVNFLRNELEKMREADPNMALSIEHEMRDKESQMDETVKLYKKLSDRLDKLSLAIESSMNDIKNLEEQLMEENYYFGTGLRNKLENALDDLKKMIDTKDKESSIKNRDIDQLEEIISDQKAEIDELKRLLNESLSSGRKSTRSIEDEVNMLRDELRRLKNDAVAAKDDLESEIEIEKVLNEEINQELERAQRENAELKRKLHQIHEEHKDMIEQFRNDQMYLEEDHKGREVQLEDSIVTRIEEAISNPEVLKKPKSKVDKMLSKFIDKVITINDDAKYDTLQPKVDEISGSIREIKDSLKDFTRRLSKSPIITSVSPIEETKSQKQRKTHFHDIPTTTDPIKKFLQKADLEYKEEFGIIKDKIDGLERIIDQTKNKKYKNSRSKYNPRMDSEITSDELSTSRSKPTPTHKNRSKSSDRVENPNNAQRSHKRWNSVQYENSSDESALLNTMQDELESLRGHIRESQLANSVKIQKAIDSINQLQGQSQAGFYQPTQSSNVTSFEVEKGQIQANLKDIMNQLEMCQDNLEKLQARVNSTENGRFIYQPILQDSMTHNDMSSILEAQKKEIERLNGLLEQLTNTTTTNPIPIQPTYTIQSTPQPVNTTFVNPPVYHSQTLPNSQTNFVPKLPLYNHQFLSHTQPIDTRSTPLLTNLTYQPNTVPISATIPETNINSARFTGLFCNIPEHHYLEDCVNNGENISKSKFKNKFKAETEKHLRNIDALQDDINAKVDELDNLEIHVSKQSGEIERLNYQIDQLNRTKQELMTEINYLKSDMENVQDVQLSSANQSLAAINSKKSILTEQIDKLEMTIESRNDELNRTENSLHRARDNLSHVQSQTGDILKKYEESKSLHKRLILECQELEKRSKEASTELVKALNDIGEVQKEVSQLSSNKVNLEETLRRIQNIIDAKDRDFKNLTEQINKATKNLSEMDYELTSVTEQSREKQKLLNEEDHILTENRMELNKLKKEILFKQEQIGQLDLELGQKNAMIHLNTEKIHKLEKNHQKILYEYQSEENQLKREISDLKVYIDNLSGNKSELMNQIEQIKLKANTAQDNLEDKEKDLLNRQAELDKLQWEVSHIENIVSIKNSQMDKIHSDYNDRMREFERLQSQIFEQQNEFKKLDVEIKGKMLEIDRLRHGVMQEKDCFDRLQVNQDTINSSIISLTKEKECLQVQMKEAQESIKQLKKQESEVQSNLNDLESKLTEARSDWERVQNKMSSDNARVDKLTEEKNILNKEIHESKCELQSIRERINSLEVQFHERSDDVRQKMQVQNKLNSEIRKLQDQIRLIHVSCEEASTRESEKKEKVFYLSADISQKTDDLKSLEKKLESIRIQINEGERKFESIKENNNSELQMLKAELGEKIEQLEIANKKINNLKKNAALKEFTEHKIIELEEIIHHHEGVIEKYELENRRLSNQVAVLKRDINNLRESHQLELENKEKELSRLRRKIAREVYQLEKLAEEQCNRANSLAEDLGQARRDYLMLRNRCLVQEQFYEQQSVFQDFLQSSELKTKANHRSTGASSPKYTSLFPNDSSPPIGATSIHNNMDEFIEEEDNKEVNEQDHINNVHHDSGFLRYTRRSNHLNTTNSSGLGSTMETPDSPENNEQLKKILHMRYGADIEKMQSDQSRCEDLCEQLKVEVKSLKNSLPNGTSSSNLIE